MPGNNVRYGTSVLKCKCQGKEVRLETRCTYTSQAAVIGRESGKEELASTHNTAVQMDSKVSFANYLERQMIMRQCN